MATCMSTSGSVSQTSFKEGASNEEIPPPSPSPQMTNVPVNTAVVIDLETTGFGCFSHILQIAALGQNKSFCRYVLPKKQIHPEAQEVHGLSFNEDEGRLYLNGQPVDAVNIRQALSEFLEFLGDEAVTLFAHNCKLFDAPVLFNAMEACAMLAEFERKVTGFVDTLPLFRAIYPGLSSYSQKSLYEHFFHESYAAHEAMSDVTALKRLLDLGFVTGDAICLHSFGLDYVRQVVTRRRETYKNLQSWKPMIAFGSVSLNMAKRAAKSGLRVHHLRLAYRLSGHAGVSNVLQQPTADGTARVTSTPKFLQTISSYIVTYPNEDSYENHEEYENAFGDDFEDGDDGSYEG
ncbi:uncharacterized protein LOC112575461 [Pomacea canaliculata]|uniref:uncharacterized protein LOC112575461 n=1 Tax=Pomacea canaliculata TaxID=400727 RepID=UPI000D72691F|nr:uncharacterized protein LOC112575461 [Pomacea canaliculata]